MSTEYKNSLVVVRRAEDGVISWRDLTDTNNDPSFFTQSKRNLDKAWDEIASLVQSSDKCTMRTVIDIIKNYDIKYHTYCAVD